MEISNVVAFIGANKGRQLPNSDEISVEVWKVICTKSRCEGKRTFCANHFSAFSDCNKHFTIVGILQKQVVLFYYCNLVSATFFICITCISWMRLVEAFFCNIETVHNISVRKYLYTAKFDFNFWRGKRCKQAFFLQFSLSRAVSHTHEETFVS